MQSVPTTTQKTEAAPMENASNPKTVYLSGPISGLSYKEAVDWRIDFATELASVHIKALNPLRSKNYLSHIKDLTGSYDNYSVLSSARGIITRDRWDTTRCDVMFVNFLGAKKVSIGTVMEIGWADICRIPIVCAMEKTDNINDHPMITEAIGFRVDSLQMGLIIIKGLLV
jgi:nucleoside 2-deoxyribosyltransferase